MATEFHHKRIEKLKVKELKQELRQLKLKVSGKKSILQKRLLDYYISTNHGNVDNNTSFVKHDVDGGMMMMNSDNDNNNNDRTKAVLNDVLNSPKKNNGKRKKKSNNLKEGPNDVNVGGRKNKRRAK